MEVELARVVLRLGNFRLQADVTFPAGCITALIGPSGSGKSSVLSAIAGFLVPESGEVAIGGKKMRHVPPGQRPVAMLFQDHNLFPHLTVAQNVGLGLRPNLRLNEAERARVESVLLRVGLGGFALQLPHALSGGQAGRVALARALLRDRPVLLLDEPFAALGPALRHQMLDFVAEVQIEKSITVLMVTHLPADAQRIAAYSAVVAEGIVTQPKPTKNLFENPPKSLRDYAG